MHHRAAYTGLLLLQHGVQYWHYPLFKFTVVVVRHQEVPYPVDPFVSQLLAREREFTEESWSQTFDEVLFDPPCSGHYYIHLWVVCVCVCMCVCKVVLLHIVAIRPWESGMRRTVKCHFPTV